MFENFPKKRIPLPPEYQSIYTEHYLENRQGTTNATNISSKMERWMHRLVADDIKDYSHPPQTLELGAGNLNHLAYEPTVKDYDIVEPFKELRESSSRINSINNAYNDIFDINSEDIYERIINIAVLEHLEDLPRIIAKCGLLLKDHGSFRAGIPNEGTILWKTGYMLTTGIEFLWRHRLNYSVMIKYEHVNTADEIEEVLKYFFNDAHHKACGLSKKLAFYRFYECKNPDKEKCRDFLKNSTA